MESNIWNIKNIPIKAGSLYFLKNKRKVRKAERIALKTVEPISIGVLAEPTKEYLQVRIKQSSAAKKMRKREISGKKAFLENHITAPAIGQIKMIAMHVITSGRCGINMGRNREEIKSNAGSTTVRIKSGICKKFFFGDFFISVPFRCKILHLMNF